MFIKKLLFIVVLLFISLNLFAAHKIDLKDNSIYINEEKIIEFREDAFGQTAQDRASILVFNLINLNNNNLLNSNNITVTDKSESVPFCVISINKVPLINVTDEDGKNLNSTALGLAKVWANNIKQALKKVPIYLLDNEIIIPLGENRTRVLYGYNLNNIEITSDNPQICDFKYNNNDNSILISGLNLGETNLTISNGEDAINLKILVKKYAAHFPDEINLNVTGNPYPNSMIYDYLNRNVLNVIKTEPLANICVNSIKYDKKAIYPNSKLVAKVNVTGYGDNYISITKTIDFIIENKFSKKDNPTKLLYSNNPETIDNFGDVYIGQLDINSCNRLLYHHMNKTGEKAKLILEIINTSDEDIQLKVSRGVAKPIVDTIAIGVVAGKEFMQVCDKYISSIDNITPNSRICYLCDNLKNNYSSSGIMEFTQLNGSKNLIVRMRLLKVEDSDINLYETRNYLGTGNFIFSDFVFNNPNKVCNGKYIVGEHYLFMPLGKDYIENEKHLKLYGNYGVTYTFNVECENPTNKTQKCRVYLDPSAGSMAAYVKINDEYKTVHHVKPPNEYNLFVFTLNPGENKNLKITTIPLSGSNYPAKIVVGNAN